MRTAIEEVGPRFRLSRTPPPAQDDGPALTPVSPPEPETDAPLPLPPLTTPIAEQETPGRGERGLAQAPPQVIRIVQVVQPPPQRPTVVVHHLHEPQEDDQKKKGEESKARTAVRAARVGVAAERLHRDTDRVKELEELGHRVADAARHEWSHLKHEGRQWWDRAKHEYEHFKHEGEHLRDRAEREAHHLEREGRGLRRRGWRDVHRIEREPGRLEHQFESEQRHLIRGAEQWVRHQPLVKAVSGLVRQTTRDIHAVGRFEQRAVRGIEHVLGDPARELKQLEQRVEHLPIVRRAESAAKNAERTLERGAHELRHPHIPGAAAAKAAALAAAADVPLEVSKAGRAAVQFEKGAQRAAHSLESEARHALAAADGHMPHQMPHVPHPPAVGPSTIAGAAAAAGSAADHALQEAAHQRMYEEVVDRLRRDLLAERERMGDIVGEW